MLAKPSAPGEGEVRARTLTPDDALLEYLGDHGMQRISKIGHAKNVVSRRGWNHKTNTCA